MNSLNKGFPNNFLFGGGFAAPQMEGGFHEGNKGISIPDCAEMIDQTNRKNHIHFTPDSVSKALSSKDDHQYPKRRGIDFYYRYAEDLKLIGEMHLRALRFSIAWTRIFPNGDEKQPNENGLLFYDKVIDEVLKNGMEPIITICHYDMPIKIVTKYGGWKNKTVIDLYLHYAKTLLNRYAGKVRYWICFNQINLLYFEGFASVGIYDINNIHYEEDCYQSLHHQFIACAKLKKYSKENFPDLKIGTMLADGLAVPYTCTSDDVILTMERNRIFQFSYCDIQLCGKYPKYFINFLQDKNIKIKFSDEDANLLKENTMDFLALSYYNTNCVNAITDGLDPAKITPNPNGKYTPWGWGMDTENLYRNLSEYYDRYHVPLMVAESGVGLLETPNEDGYVEDDIRIKYYQGCLQSVRKALENGVEIFSYCAWSPIDIISSGSGEMSKRYGMIYVDQDDQGNGTKKRTPKKSYYWYKKVIDSNGKCL